MVLYPNKLPESERVCSGICNIYIFIDKQSFESTTLITVNRSPENLTRVLSID